MGKSIEYRINAIKFTPAGACSLYKDIVHGHVAKNELVKDLLTFSKADRVRVTYTHPSFLCVWQDTYKLNTVDQVICIDSTEGCN